MLKRVVTSSVQGTAASIHTCQSYIQHYWDVTHLNPLVFQHNEGMQKLPVLRLMLGGC